MQETIRLSNGFLMPRIALGTYGLSKDEAYDVVSRALAFGYRHIETAPIYLNEDALGKAIKDSGIPREDLFVTSKIPPHIKTYEGTLRVARRSMDALGVSYLDALLINNPVPWGKEGEDHTEGNRAVWRALEALHDEEAVASIGVSHFDVPDLEAIIETARVMPVINQIGVFVGHPLDDIRAFCEDRNITIQGHSPYARGRLLTYGPLLEKAARHGMTPAGLALSYVLSKGVFPVVKATSDAHLRENLEAANNLPEDLIRRLDAINHDVRDYLPPGAKWVL